MLSADKIKQGGRHACGASVSSSTAEAGRSRVAREAGSSSETGGAGRAREPSCTCEACT